MGPAGLGKQPASGGSGRVTQVPGRCPSDTRAGRVCRWSSSGAFSNSWAQTLVICKASVCSTVSLLRMWVTEIFGEDLRLRGLKVESEERQVNPAAAERGHVRAEPGLQGGGAWQRRSRGAVLCAALWKQHSWSRCGLPEGPCSPQPGCRCPGQHAWAGGGEQTRVRRCGMRQKAGCLPLACGHG